MMNRHILLILTGSCCLSGCIATTLIGSGTASSDAVFDERSLGRHFDDAAIASVIDARLIGEKDLPSRWVSAEVIEGDVMLTGYLPRQEQIDRTLYICRHVSGVRSVRSEIKLGRPPAGEFFSDVWITTKVKRKLLNDHEIAGFSVHVETVKGKVYLQGLVKTRVQRHRAHTLAASVKGVASVVNLLRIKEK